jgi:hypothetical protein
VSRNKAFCLFELHKYRQILLPLGDDGLRVICGRKVVRAFEKKLMVLIRNRRFGVYGSLFSAGFGSSVLVISSIGFGGGVVAIVQPIHAPMPIIAMNATRTGMAMIQNWTFAWVS